ncbi:MAG: ATP--guanido phosphotransferase [Elusimicrobia bacterium]|nr:ATP--guanido phosphotransferase [Elusimicrobiota bacterium]
MTLQNMLKVKMGWVIPTGPFHEVVLSSRVRVARNLRRQPFPASANPKAAAAVVTAAFEAARKTHALKPAAYLKLEELEPVERLFLVERRLVSQTLALEPKNRAAVVGEREILSAMVNEEDHLRLQAVDSGLCVGPLWTQLDRLDEELSDSLDYATDPRWGYLTACPTNTGTGLRASALAHLPALSLTGELNGVLQGLPRLGLSARGMYGEGTKVIGDFYQISNATALGRAEGTIVEEVRAAVTALVQREQSGRERLARGSHRTRLEDLVYRGLGAMSQARCISFEETMQHLSYVRLALTLGWKVPATFELLNDLVMLCQPAHIQMLAGRELEAADRDLLRATLLRKKFKAP